MEYIIPANMPGVPDGRLTTGDFDEDKYPIPPKRIERNKAECVHTPIPASYHDWYEWCEQASKTHDQVRCLRCGKAAIWLPKREAKAINKREEKEAKEFCDAMEAQTLRDSIEASKARLRKLRKDSNA